MEKLTAEQFQARYGNKGSAPERLTAEQFQARYGNKKGTDFALIPDKWETGTDDSTDRSFLGNVATGVGKTLARTPVNIAQTFTKDSWFDEDSLLNSESEKAKAFAEATRREGTTQKVAGGLTDIATLFAPGGIAKAGTLAKTATAGRLAKSVPGYAKLATQATKTGGFARLAPKVVGNTVEGLIGSAATKGPDDDVNLGRELAWGFGTPLLTTGVKNLKYLTKASREAEKLNLQKLMTEATETVNPLEFNQFNKTKDFNKKLIETSFDDAAEGGAVKKFDKNETNRLVGLDLLNDGDTVVDNMLEFGGPDGIQKNGKWSTEKVVKNIEDQMNSFGKTIVPFLKSSTKKFTQQDLNNIDSSIDSWIATKGKKLDAKEAKQVKQGMKDQITELMNQHKNGVSPYDIHLEKSKLNDAAFGKDNQLLDATSKQSKAATADFLKEWLLKNVNDGNQYQKWNDEFTKMFSAKKGFEQLSKLKPDKMLPGFLDSIAGVVGYNAGGPLFGVLSSIGSGQLRNVINRGVFMRNKQNLYNAVTNAKRAGTLQKLVADMEKIADQNISKAAKEKKLADYLKAKASNKAKTQAFKEAQKREFEMPDIQMGQKPKRNLRGMIEMGDNPNVFGTKTAGNIKKLQEENLPDIQF